MKEMKEIIRKIPNEYISHGILVMAMVSMAGSLFFSEVMSLPPCVLCWYQRIAMYPIVALAILGIVRSDKNMGVNVLALSIPGLIISTYHNLLYWEILPESAAPCTLGISCTTKFFEWFGFITIPFMALSAFTIITVLAFISLKKNK